MVEAPEGSPSERGAARRDSVLTAALATFVQHGYRKTSMEEIAGAADISRPGLYFLFSSKQELFAAAIARALEQDLDRAAAALADGSRLLPERLLAAFDIWTGRYLGKVGGELSAVAEAHTDLLGATASAASLRFRALVGDAVADARPLEDRATSAAISRTLLSTAVGLKHQAATRDSLRADLGTAISLLLR